MENALCSLMEVLMSLSTFTLLSPHFQGVAAVGQLGGACVRDAPTASSQNLCEPFYVTEFECASAMSALLHGGGGRSQPESARGSEDSAVIDLHLTEAPQSVMVTVTRESYSWRAAAAQACVGWRMHCDDGAHSTTLLAALARALKLGIRRLSLVKEGQIFEGVVAEGDMYTLRIDRGEAASSRASTHTPVASRTRSRTPSRGKRPQAEPPVEGEGGDELGEMSPDEEAAPATAVVSATVPFVAQQEGVASVVPSTQCDSEATAACGEATVTSTRDVGIQVDVGAVDGYPDHMCVVLQGPSIFRVPPATQRESLDLSLVGSASVYIRVEDQTRISDLEWAARPSVLRDDEEVILGEIMPGDRIRFPEHFGALLVQCTEVRPRLHGGGACFCWTRHPR